MSGGSRRRSESLVSVTFCDNICRGPGFLARPAGLEIGFAPTSSPGGFVEKFIPFIQL